MIRALQPDAQILGSPTKWEAATGDLLKCDLVFGSVDSFIARRDLEAFCRRNLLPYIDIGMDVVKNLKAYDVFGQVFLSMPGSPCMCCFGLLNAKNLAEEAQRYGDAGSNKLTWLRHPLQRRFQDELAAGISNWREMVRSSWQGKFAYVQEEKDAAGVVTMDGLRMPQIGALHAIGAHWTLGPETATVVMPTGTGNRIFSG